MENLEKSAVDKNIENKLINGTKNIDIIIPLFEGPKPIENWTQNYNQPLYIINSLKKGDKLNVKVSEVGPDTNCQLRISWGDEKDQYVSWTNCYKNGVPYNYELELKEEHISSIKKSGKLYLNGCNITVDKWTLIQNKSISNERGNASTIIWTGSQIIDWNISPKKYVKLDNSSFTDAKIGMKLRINFINIKVWAQGHISSSNWKDIPDANTNENLTYNWGDYYEFMISNDMLVELQENGVIITGVGYTLKSVELIDPMKEYQIVSSFNRDDIIAWEKKDGIPKLTVKMTNFEEKDINTTISANLMTDMLVDYKNYSTNIQISAGQTKEINLQFPDLIPGFYRMYVKVNGNSVCTYFIGYDPTNIISPDDSQPDFWKFWDDWKTDLASININAQLELLNNISNGSRNIYIVKLMSSPDKKGGEAIPIWGYYAEPKEDKIYPCLIHYHGTDMGTGKPPIPKTDENSGWCELYISVRGQMLSREKNGNVYLVDGKSDFYSYGLGNNDEHYYRAAYLDTRRAIDFVWSRTKVNKNSIFAEGGSQGGCFTYVGAALSDGRIKAIAPSITGHADFIHTMEIVGWPTDKFNNWINSNYPNNYEEGKAALLKHQSYFDTKNFSSRITCPVITNFSLQDFVDGPHLNISPYNLLTKVSKEDKKYIINQFLGHSPKHGWDKDYMSFFEKYINKFVINIKEEKFDTYYNSVASKIPSGIRAGIIIDIDNLNKSVIIVWCYNGDQKDHCIIPGGTGVLLSGSPGNYKFDLIPENKDEPPKNNLLKGCDVRTVTTGGELYYKLGYNSKQKDELGFCYGTDEGKSFVIKDHKAWLALTNQQSSNTDFFQITKPH